MKTENKPQHTQGELKIRINNIGFKLMANGSPFSIAIIENKWRSGEINEANAKRIVKAWNFQNLLDEEGNDGCDFLRSLVEWMDNRDEHANQNKSISELVTEFKNKDNE